MRGLGSLVASLLVVTALFRMWPTDTASDQELRFAVQVEHDEMVEIEVIEPTRQEYAIPPAPPPPPQDVLLPPVEVPDTEIIEEGVENLELELPVRNPVLSAPPAPPSNQGPPGDVQPSTPPPAPTVVRNPDRRPNTVRFAWPVYPEEARRNDYRAGVVYEVLVDERGRRISERVTSRYRLYDDGRQEPVTSLPYGLEQAAYNALLSYQFRPARHDGQAVRSYLPVTIRVGVN